MKKIIFLACVLSLFIFGDVVEAKNYSENVNLILNGKDITNVQKPFILNDRTMLPLRAVSEEMGYEVKWIKEKREAIIVTSNTDSHYSTITFQIDSDFAVMDSTSLFEPVKVDLLAKPVIMNDRTFLPVRDLGELLGLNVKWTKATRTVTLTY